MSAKCGRETGRQERKFYQTACALHNTPSVIKFYMKRFLMSGLCLFFAGILFLMLRSDRETLENLKFKKSNSFVEGLQILYRRDGNTVWKLNARRADFSEDENMAELSNLTVTVQKNGLTLYADKGEYDLLTKNFTINSDTQVEAEDYRILTSSIDYDASTGDVTTDEKIVVEGKTKKFTIEGRGGTLDSKQNVRIHNDVKATFYK